MASSPNGSRLLFFSASLAFFFFFRLIFSLSLLDLTRGSWCVACCIQVFALPSSSLVVLDRRLTLMPPTPSACFCLSFLITRNTTRGSRSSRARAKATTAHNHEGFGSLTATTKMNPPQKNKHEGLQ